MGYKARISKGETAAREVATLLGRGGIEYAVTGYELLQSTAGYTRAVTKIDSESSAALRFLPDFHLARGARCAFLEVKCSSGIERAAYSHYGDLAARGLEVFLCLKRKSKYYVTSIKNLKFDPMPERCTRAKMKVPRDGVWRCARLLPEADYIAYKKAMGGSTSGCDFAFINYSAPMLSLAEFIKYF